MGFGRARGVVSDYDDHRGWGTVDAPGMGEQSFHCTAIAGGSRTIAVGTEVDFEVVAGHGGRWEAADVRPVEGSAPVA